MEEHHELLNRIENRRSKLPFVLSAVRMNPQNTPSYVIFLDKTLFFVQKEYGLD